MGADPSEEGRETFYEVAWVCTCSHSPPGYGLDWIFYLFHPSLLGHSRHPWRKKEEPKRLRCGGYNIYDKRPRKRERRKGHETRENNCSMPSRRWGALRVMRFEEFEEFEGVTRAVAFQHSQSGHTKRLERLVRS